MKEHKEQALALIAAGSRDALALQLLNQTGRAPHESIGFHAQQACEKFIKARLVLSGIVFERTHDLVALGKLASQHQITIPVNVETLRALNSYAVQFRYEGCTIELVPSIECEVVSMCLLTWVNEALNQT
jgi:HEPN domain-containing protein